MKKALFILLLIPGISYSQIIKDKVDEFTGNRGIVTAPVNLKGDFKAQVLSIVSGDDTTYAMNFYFPTRLTSVDDQSTVSFKLEDSSIIKFTNAGGYKICDGTSLCSILVSLTKADLEKLLNQKVLLSRIKTTDHTLDFTIKEKLSNKLEDQIKLLFARLQGPVR